MTFFGFWRRKAAIPRRNPSARPVDVERKHEKAERVRRESFHGPPLSEWERDAMYAAVEAERNRYGKSRRDARAEAGFEAIREMLEMLGR